MNLSIKEPSWVCAREAQERFDNLIKPRGSLGKLEKMVGRFAAIRQTANIEELQCEHRAVVIFGAPGSMNRVLELLEKEKNIYGSDMIWEPVVILAESPKDAMEEGCILVHECLSKYNCQVVVFALLDEEELTLQAAAGGILQAAALGTGIFSDDRKLDRPWQLAKKENRMVEGYCLNVNGVQIDCGDEVGLRGVFECSLLEAGLKCYREMQTFAEAGVAKSLVNVEGGKEK